PEYYDRYLGPLLFAPYARDLVGRLPRLTAGPVLEVACGTGIVTDHLRKALPAGMAIVATDLNEPMLTYARAARPLGAGVEWRPADAQALPFPDAAFEAIVCQFGLMFVPDKAAALQEARRVLKRGGMLAFNVWAAFPQNPIGRIADQLISSYFPDDPPTFYRVPFGLDDEAGLREMLTASGFEVVAAERVTLMATSPSATDAAQGLVFGNPVQLAIQERGTVPPATIAASLADALAAVGGSAPFSAPMCALVFVARAT
ncbi:MAG: methyltransferase domain-containing protein, partial [Gemmatimonadota bacterium]|nr:methyltransferase domain-containing protein [Gemmatimonadota bacterium]